MRRGKTKGSQLLIFPDGTLYHIDLKRGDNLPQNVLLVGAASRVDAIAALFDKVTFMHQNRIRPEFYIKAGSYKGVPMAVMSIGIGVSNVEIAMTEFHALFEYDLASDSWAVQKPDINFIRIGTCGTTQREIGPGSLAIS